MDKMKIAFLYGNANKGLEETIRLRKNPIDNVDSGTIQVPEFNGTIIIESFDNNVDIVRIYKNTILNKEFYHFENNLNIVIFNIKQADFLVAVKSSYIQLHVVLSKFGKTYSKRIFIKKKEEK